MCRSTLQRWEPFNPKVIHACICIQNHRARQTSKTRPLDIKYIFFPSCPFLTHALVFEQGTNYYTRRKHEIWPVQRHYDGSIFHTFIFICSYLNPHLFFFSFIWTNLAVCITIHMQAEMILFIHQSTLDSVLFKNFFIGSHLRAECQIPCLQQLETRPPVRTWDWAFVVWLGPSNLSASSLL